MKFKETLKKYLNRYFVDAMGSMAQGLFASLLIGTIFKALGMIPHLEILAQIGGFAQAMAGPAMAAAIAYKEGIPQTSPALLEPIGTLKVLVPDEMLGDVIGDINKRRGRIIGMNPAENKMQEIIGEVPMAEMSDFSTAMRSITQGTATFTLEIARYEEVPQMLAQKIIEAANK